MQENGVGLYKAVSHVPRVDGEILPGNDWCKAFTPLTPKFIMHFPVPSGTVSKTAGHD